MKWVLIALSACLLYLLFIKSIEPIALNSESLDVPLAVARIQNPELSIWKAYKALDPGAFSYPNHTFHADWPILSSPATIALYWPFIKALGVTPLACGAYSAFFCLLAIGLTYWFASIMYDHWTALLSCLFLISSLSWMIHVKACIAPVMPSVCVMIGIAYCLWEYNKRQWPPKIIALWGTLLAFAYLLGWIVFPFAVIMTALGLIAIERKDFLILFVTSFIIGFWFVIAYSSFVIFYSFAVHHSFAEITNGILTGYLYRSDSVPAAHLNVIQKAFYALKCTFIDSTAFDHPDKYFEGHPAIPLFFTGWFLIGLWYARRELILKAWLISTYGVLMTVYLFSGRYGLLALPCFAIISAVGVSKLFKYKFIFLILITCSILLNYNDYLVFRDRSEPNFERDRMRGHAEFSKWLKSNYNPNDTLVVLNDPINLSAWQLMFHTYHNPFQFLYWNGLFNATSTPDDLKKWEKTVPCENIVYVFSGAVIGDPPINDWSTFRRAYPLVRIAFHYEYNGQTLFMAGVIKK